MANELKIVYRKVDELIPYEKNPRRNDAAVDPVANSIKEFGFKIPIVLDENDVIVSGHTRLRAAKKLGLKEVPTIVANDLTEEQVKAFRIADNKTAEKSIWDIGLLVGELQDLALDFDFSDFGFSDFEIASLTDDGAPETYDNELIEKYTVPEEDLLQRKRIIITYTGEEQEEFLKGLLKVDALKVTHDCEVIMAKYQ